MAQHDYVIANGTGAAVRSDLNNALAAIVSQNSGATAPATTYAFQFWADTTTGLLKLRNSANSAWVTLFQLDGEWSTLPIENGTAAAPSIYFKDSGTDTGFYSPGTDQVAISTGGTGRLFIDSSGRCGIGTSTPTDQLTIKSSGNFSVVGADNSSATGGGVFIARQNGAAKAYFGVSGAILNDTSSDLGLFAETGSAIRFYNNGSTTAKAILDTSGRLGIGSTTLIERVHVNGGVRLDVDNQGLYFNSSTTSINGNGTSSYITFNTSNVEKARLDSSGRFLVGTSNVGSSSYNSHYSKVIIAGNTSDNTFGRLTIKTNTAAASISSGTYIGEIFFSENGGGDFANITCQADGTAGANDFPGRLVFSVTADGASSPTERMRIKSDGYIYLGDGFSNTNHRISGINDVQGDLFLVISAYQNSGGSASDTAYFYGCGAFSPNAAAAAVKFGHNTSTSRSINASGTVNASGADYAEYMTKAGDFTIAKGDVCGVTADGLLTLDYGDAVSFVVKSTNPSYVGGDTWGGEEAVGPKPDADDADALPQWEADLEAARQKVDRIAFAGQVPVNVMGANPGQYIVPVQAADGGIEGIAKDEADLTLAEYMRAVGKVIAIEDDGRARIIVKVA